MPGPIPHTQHGDDTRLIFHSRPDRARTAVAFIHGLGGHFYDNWGAESCPGAFIARMANDLPEAAIATFAYPSGLNRFLGSESLTLAAVTSSWMQVVRDSLLRRYGEVAIVGHCLGGLLTTLALRQLLMAGDTWPRRLRQEQNHLSLFLLDSPHDLPETGPTEWLAGLMEALSFDAGTLRENAAFWRDRMLRESRHRCPIPTYAVVSERESWVTPLSPTANLPESRICHVGLSHTELARPAATGPFAPYDFVLARLLKRV